MRIASSVFAPHDGSSLLSQDTHTFKYGRVRDPVTHETIDEAIALVWRAPRSYTREDVVEISVHGGPVPLRRTLSAVMDSGARLAEPGEFTKRAFLAGRIDLAQAEAVCDLIAAKTQASGRLAVRQLEGRLSEAVSEARSALLDLLAGIEAGIDFPEHDVEEVTRSQIRAGLESALKRVSDLARTAAVGRVYREGVRVALVGRPNVGKSSLLNALLGQERAIVTSVPGTTRDLIEETVSIEGIPFLLIDTAGLRHAQDEVEQIGVSRAERALREADVSVVILDAAAGLLEEDRDVLKSASGGRVVVAVNKTDLSREGSEAAAQQVRGFGLPVIRISALTREGLDDLRQALCDAVVSGAGVESEPAVVTSARHEDCMLQAVGDIERAIDGLDSMVPYDLVSIDIRAALDRLGLITGETASDDLLDSIFSRFCIGK
jgi:tRNA modification GTPase